MLLIPTIIGMLGAVINRVRGGWLKDEWFDGSTQTVRFIWSLVFALVIFFGIHDIASIQYQEVSWWRIPLLIVFGFAAWSLFGSGAHSVYDFNAWKEQWLKGNYPDDTEIYSQWILPKLFGGKPDATWSEERFLGYHLLGKGMEGFIRNVVCVCPVVFLSPGMSIVYCLSGLTWGVLFYFATILPRIGSLSAWNLGEILVGFVSFFVLGVMLYAA